MVPPPRLTRRAFRAEVPPLTEADVARFASTVLRPAGARAAEARAAVEGIRDPREAWEVLATRGLIPLEWVGEPRRVFKGMREVALVIDGRPATRYEPDGSNPHPLTVETAVVLAADAAGVLSAEQRVREAAARMRVWGVELPDLVGWRVEAAPRPRNYDVLPWHNELAAFRQERGFDREIDVLLPRDEDQWRARWIANALVTLERSRAWDAAAAAYSSFRSLDSSELREILPRGSDPRRFPEALNPFEPLLALWEQGYGVDGVSDDALVLVAPPLAA